MSNHYIHSKEESIKFIVFDWDGTLMDSAGRIVSCMGNAIAQLGLPKRSQEQMRYIIGLGMNEAIDALFPDVDVDKHRLAAAYRNEFMIANTTPAQLYHGVREMLTELEKQGYWLAVATGKSRSGLNHVLAEMQLNKQFHATRCANETASKPNPLMLNELMDEFGFTCDETVMVGDTEFDIQMAHAAKVTPVAVQGGAHHKSHLEKFNPAIILNDITEIISWLKPQ